MRMEDALDEYLEERSEDERQMMALIDEYDSGTAVEQSCPDCGSSLTFTGRCDCGHNEF